MLIDKEESCSYKEQYVYIKSTSRYFWLEQRVFLNKWDAAENLNITPAKLRKLRKDWEILDYDKICYKVWWEKFAYNLLDESKLLSPSHIPIIEYEIENLINNVCGHKAENIDWLHKAILYKVINPNDVHIPAVILYWQWGSWKWTLMKLLAIIFWEENVLDNLQQHDLTSNFNSFKWDKLIVEFAEVSSQNNHLDTWITNKLKNFIWADKITVHEKNMKAYSVENICWFFISSNSIKPIQLDDSSVWNRRFTVIKSESKLENTRKVYEVINDKEKVSNYLAWLLNKYPEVKYYHKLTPLDNQDKKDLEEISKPESNKFWIWVEENNPSFIWKKSLEDIEPLFDIYCNENLINLILFKKYFWNTSIYQKKKIRLGKTTTYWVDIPENKDSVTEEFIKNLF